MSVLDAVMRLFADRSAVPQRAESRFEARLPSAVDDAYFHALIRLAWPFVRSGPPAHAVAQAEHRLRGVAEQVARCFSPLDAGSARTALNLELRRHLILHEANLRLEGVQVDLTAEPRGCELAAHFEELRRQATVARADQQARLDRVRMFGADVLRDPLLARLWWLDGKIENLPQMVQLDSVFEQAAVCMGGATSEDQIVADPLPGLVRAFLDGLRPEHRELLLRQLAHVFVSYERPELARSLDGLRPDEV